MTVKNYFKDKETNIYVINNISFFYNKLNNTIGFFNNTISLENLNKINIELLIEYIKNYHLMKDIV